MINYIQKAEIVITHAGIGSILLCLILDKVPIIFPRYADLKEHVDDHQVEISLRLEKEKAVLVSYNDKDLLHKINHYHQMKKKCGGSIKKPTEKGLLLFLREIIEEQN
jgi:UDP-N-acetylglucosamine transferase subunit ALG13